MLKREKIVAYLRSRFPVAPLFLYAFLTMLGISSIISSPNYLKIFIAANIYVLFLFHLRILDEFKDFAYDKKNHSDRPVHQGLISLEELKLIGFLNIFIISILSAFLTSFNISLYLLITLLYTYLMYKEFFIKNFLKSHTVLYLTSHEVVFIPLFIYFFSIFKGDVWIVNSWSAISLLIYAILPILLIEIGRKMKHRYDAKGRRTDDTYVYEWGEIGTIRVFASLITIAGFLSIFIQSFNFILTTILLLSGIIIFLMSSKYHKTIVKYHMSITTIFALILPTFLIL